MIYLDNAATTFQKPDSVWRSVLTAGKTCATPGRGTHQAAMNAAEQILKLRESACDLFGFPDPESVVLTINATHGLNMAIRTLAGQYPRAVISGYEHNAVVRPLTLYGVQTDIVRSPLFDRNAFLAEFERKISAGNCFAVCTHVSNAFGFRLPLEEVCELCRKRRVPLIADASQSAGCLSLREISQTALFTAMPGHKGLYGPQGTGLLLCRELPEPLLAGGTGGNSALQTMPDFLPDRGEAGTPNIPGAAGLTAGIDFVRRTGEKQILRHEVFLKNRACELLSRIDGVTPYWTPDESLQTGVFSFTVRGISPEDMAHRLGERGFAVRAGLHCAPQAHLSAGTITDGTVRVSFSAFSTEEEVLSFFRTVRQIQRKSS